MAATALAVAQAAGTVGQAYRRRRARRRQRRAQQIQQRMADMQRREQRRGLQAQHRQQGAAMRAREAAQGGGAVGSPGMGARGALTSQAARQLSIFDQGTQMQQRIRSLQRGAAREEERGAMFGVLGGAAGHARQTFFGGG